MEDFRAKYGTAFTLHLPIGGMQDRVVVVSDPDAVKDVFGLGPDEGHAGKANIVLKPFLGKHSLLLLDGLEHQRQRKMMMPAFHGDRMQAYGATMLDAAHASIERWPLDARFSIHGPMQSITLDVIVRTVFGVSNKEQLAELASLLGQTLDASAWPGLLFPWVRKDFGPWSPWGRWLRLFGRASELLRMEIRKGREQGTAGRTDILAMMLDARDERGEPLEEDEIHDELVTLLVAGHETTATSLAWALRWVLPDADLTARLREELDDAGGDPARIAKLELLDGVVREALRLQPVIPLVGRVLQEPTRIGRHDLPEGVVVAPSVYLVHRDQRLYPRPDSFEPDRWSTFKAAQWEWLPFGGGLRRCIGAAFAIYEMKMVLAAVLARTDLKLATRDVKVVRRSITLTPSEGLPVVMTARRGTTHAAA
jgi:cytochrome P450